MASSRIMDWLCLNVLWYCWILVEL